MAETVASPPSVVADEQAAVHQQLDLTAEAGWDNPDQLVLPTQGEVREDPDFKYRGQEVAIDKDGIETGWEFFSREVASGNRPAGSRVENGAQMITVRSPAGEGAWLVKEIPAAEFDELQVLKAQREAASTSGTLDTPGHPESQDSQAYRELEFDVKPLVAESASLPEMPDFSRPEERDWRRIEREAKTYFDNFEDPQEIIDLRQDLAGHEKAVKSALLKHFQELGIADVNNEYVIEKVVVQKTNEALAAAKNKKVAELVQKALPYEEDSRKEKKQVNKARESLARLLDMPQEQFDQLLKDWQHHEINEAHGEALKEDKKYKIGEQRRAARGEIAELDEKYGGVLEEISQLPLDKEAGGSTHQSIHDYFERKQKINSLEDTLVEKEDLEDVSVAQGVRDLQGQLRQKYRLEGLSEEQIQAKLDESSGALETWLRSIDDGNTAQADLESFKNQGNKEQMLSGRRQKAAEYIGSTIFMSALKGALRREKSAEVKSEINISEVFHHGIDHNGSRAQGGAEVLSNPEKAASFRGKVMAQLEMARTLSRNENTLMKALIYYTAVEKSLGTGFVSAWEAIPEEKKKQARKKLMLGMAATSSAIARMSAKAAAKARNAGATGAATGTIWAGNKLKR